DKEECIEWIAEQFGDSVEPQLSDAIGHVLCDEFFREEGSPSPNKLDLKIGRWVIRDADVDLFDTIKDGALLFCVFTQVAPASSAAISFGVALSRLLWTLHRRGAKLSRRAACVFTALRAAKNGLTPKEIAERLQHDPAVEEVQRILRDLQTVPTRGEPTLLASQLSNGKWVAHG